MRVSVVQVDGCPHASAAAARVTEALARLGLADVPVETVVVTTAAQAAQAGAGGSPTVLVDGRDVFPGSVDGGLSCRLYRTPAGLEGAPSVEQLVEQIRNRLGDHRTPAPAPPT